MRNSALILAVIFLSVALIGCGGGNDSTTTTEEDQTSSTSDQTSNQQENQDTTTEDSQTTTETDTTDQLTIGKDLVIELGCGSCHTIKAAGLDLGGLVGPDLSNEASRNRTAEWMKIQLTDPTAIPDSEVVEGFEGQQVAMPDYARDLSDEELDALIAFLLSLDGQ